MSEIVERVARAIEAMMFAPHEMPLSDALHAKYLDTARAAIEAMREPTPAMLIGARDWSLAKNGRGVGNDQATGCWQAMIDAALISEREAEE